MKQHVASDSCKNLLCRPDHHLLLDSIILPLLVLCILSPLYMPMAEEEDDPQCNVGHITGKTDDPLSACSTKYRRHAHVGFWQLASCAGIRRQPEIEGHCLALHLSDSMSVAAPCFSAAHISSNIIHVSGCISLDIPTASTLLIAQTAVCLLPSSLR